MEVSLVVKRKVLLTINPQITAGNRFSTMRQLVRRLDDCCELHLAPLDGYDFKRGKVTTYKRTNGGFEKIGKATPRADLWIVYTDGFYLDHEALGFRIRRDYFKAQLDFHQEQLRLGNVRLMVNSPETEARTLKSWLATLDFKRYSVIPTYVFSSIAEVHDFQRARGTIVAKPVWGGSYTGIVKLRSEAHVREFQSQLAECDDRDLSDYCFQIYCRGNEKRFWFAGGRCLAARIIHGRQTPWSEDAPDFWVDNYSSDISRTFTSDMEAARRLFELSGLSVGSIDFIGGRVNEVNGGGTVLTTLDYSRNIIIDARPGFLEYIVGLLDSL
jgi:hypothetical protein